MAGQALYYGMNALSHNEMCIRDRVYIMRVMISIILMVIAAVVGFFFGAGMNEAMGLSLIHIYLQDTPRRTLHREMRLW